MTNLSKYITEEQFLHSNTATKLHLDNSWDKPWYRKNAILLCESVIDFIVVHYGKGIEVHSGFRSTAVNKAVGGVDKVVNGVRKVSQHCEGKAIDFTIKGVDLKQIFNDIASGTIKNDKGIPLISLIDQMIIENLTNNKVTSGSWIHISVTETPRKQKLLAEFNKGVASYKSIDSI